MAYSAHSREDSHSSFYPRAPVSNSRHASPEAELEETAHSQDKRESASALSDGHHTSSSAGETPGGGAGGAGGLQHNGNGAAGGTSSITGLYDGTSPFFGSSGIPSTSSRRFPSPYGTPVSTPGAGSFYPPLSLQANGARSPYSAYLQQHALLNRGQHHQYLHDPQSSSQNLHNPVIAPSYLQQQQHPGHPGTSANMQHPTFSAGGSGIGRSHLNVSQGNNSDSNNLASAVDSAMAEIEDDDDDEDGEEESSEDESSFGDDAAFQDEAADTNVRKRRRKGGATQAGTKGNSGSGGTPSKKAKGEDGAQNAKGNRKGKAKVDTTAKEDTDSKSKSTRGSKACTVCRRLKMRCEPSPDGDESKCKRCKAGGHECIFEESQRGRRKNQKTDAMAKSIKNMENTLETVLKAIATGNAHTVAGMSLGTDGNLVATTSTGQQTQAPTISPQPSATPKINLPTLPTVDPSLSNTYTEMPTGNASHSADSSNMGQTVSDSFSNSAPLSHGIFSIKTEETINGSNGQGSSPALRLHTLPEPENTWAPLGLLAEASLENNQSKRRRSTFTASDLPHNLNASEEIRQARNRDNENKNVDNGKLGVANDAYFQPGPFNILPLRQLMIDKNLPSPLLTERIITVEEAVMLFNLYHKECSMFTAHYLLEDWHTPINVSSRSTFLFTTICAVASKFYEARPELYGLCMPYARKLASDMIERGFKSVEIVQAYMLLAYYNTPTERFEDDRTWTYIGLAIRMAVELNLWRNPKQPPDLDEEGIASFAMETVNRERTWYQIFIMDRSIAIQTGRPHSLRVGNFERNVKSWSQRPSARIPDIGLAAIVELYRITSGFQDLLQLSCFERSDDANLNDYAIVTRSVDNALENWNAEWGTNTPETVPNRHLAFTAAMKAFYFHYHRLLAYSFALQQILKVSTSSLEILPYFLPAYESASQVLKVAREQLHALGHLKYAPDLVFINISYAAVFLLKLLRPELKEFTDSERILNEVEEMVVTLERCSVDAVHTPALYAGFLRLLLAAKRGKDDNGENGIKLDPALASKLSADQNQHFSGLSTTLADSAAPRHEGQDGTSTVPAIFAQDNNGNASRPNGMGSNAGASAFLSGEPSNQPSGAFWNLDQLGQAGFWENLSMPGLGSPPTYGLSAGHLFQGDPWPFSTPNSASVSRATSPKLGASHGSFISIPNMPSL
ncbi:hypothetical protein P389DRAFT_172123 [Cystobasidium minutum MCA 4210]|uniref:uncharacterized protein n=1 Tax=Cystobasidium minutum MCA 4210 TaxID=1397322 RepID=UPI0034CD18A8|eukprot:jgi/Rhomi1/172123/fgenesh1_kg.4_\